MLRAAAVTLTLAAGAAVTPSGFPNSLAFDRPPRGWRSWSAFASAVNQTLIESVMDAMVKKRAGGVSLADLGYTDVGLDAGWQACGAGVNGSYHSGTTGHVIVDDKFPDMRAMTDHAHRLGLTASWYLNADGCESQSNLSHTYYTNDSDDAVHKFNYDGVKFDSQMHGPDHNISRWAAALNATGKAVMIENCLDKHPQYLLKDPEYCPFNFYRSGGDNSPSFHGGMWNMLGNQLPFLEVTSPVPASRPGCWAYMDMLSIGAPQWGSGLQKQAAARGCPPMTLQEEASLFAGWAITSSPLILSFDVVNDTGE